MNSRVYPFVGDHDVQSCINCGIGHLCLGKICTRSQLLHIDQQIKHPMIAQKSAAIIHQDSPFINCYIVKAGSVKIVHLNNNQGDEKIMGFHFPGEVFGVEGILEGRNTCSAIALERSTLCKINYRKLHGYASEVPALQDWLLRSALQELHNMEVLARWLSYTKPEERIVSFLIDVSERQRLLSWHTGKFRLPMSRRDIGNFLGLALETVSRVLHRLQRSGDLSVRNRHIELHRVDSLRERIATVETTSGPNQQPLSHPLSSSFHTSAPDTTSDFTPALSTLLERRAKLKINLHDQMYKL